MSTSATKPKSRTHSRPKAAAGMGQKPRANFVHETVSRLEKQIIRKRFAPGEKMPTEHQLSESLGVSRTVIREAMRVLIARGLIETSRGRPARVKPADPVYVVQSLSTFLQRGDHSLLNLVEVRLPLESEIAALASHRATPEQIAEMVAANERLASAESIEKAVTADIEFHDCLAKATGNPVFGILLSTLSDLMRRSRRKTLARTGKEVALEGHRAVLQAVRLLDPAAAREAMLSHLIHAEQDLRDE